MLVSGQADLFEQLVDEQGLLLKLLMQLEHLGLQCLFAHRLCCHIRWHRHYLVIVANQSTVWCASC